MKFSPNPRPIPIWAHTTNSDWVKALLLASGTNTSVIYLTGHTDLKRLRDIVPRLLKPRKPHMLGFDRPKTSKKLPEISSTP